MKNEKYRSFEDAREFARGLGLKNKKEWYEYCKSGNKPDNIPNDPYYFYKKTSGWISWGDFLGSEFVATHNRDYVSYEEVKTCIHPLNLISGKEWKDYVKSGNKPDNIPNDPQGVYTRTGEWVSWGDFLGTEYIHGKYREYLTYEEVKLIVHPLELQSRKEWYEYCKSGNKPDNIPNDPQGVYTRTGEWVSWSDFLASKYKKSGWPSYEELKLIAHPLKLQSKKEWSVYCKSGKISNNIPNTPDQVYKNKGWVSWGDFLGTEYIANYNREYFSYEDAKLVIHPLNIKSQREWYEYCKSGSKPDGIPVNAQQTYKKKGWISWGDFLGSNNKKGGWLSHEEARNYVHSLQLENAEQWKIFCESGNKPNNIPSNPRGVYKNNGWVSLSYFLGSKHKKGGWISYEEAKLRVHSLKLNSGKEWYEYIKTGNKPENTPNDPRSVYKKTGEWKGWADFLGYFGDGNHAWSKSLMLRFIDEIKTELYSLENIQLITILSANNIDKKLEEMGLLQPILQAPPKSKARKAAIEEAATKLGIELEKIEGEEVNWTTPEEKTDLLLEIDDISKVDDFIDLLEETQEDEPTSLSSITSYLESYDFLDKDITIKALDDETLDFLKHYNINKMWRDYMNGKIDIESITQRQGGENFTYIKETFLNEYEALKDIEKPNDYIFAHEPNMMQKLIVHRLKENTFYGNWSGTGAGKTLSALYAGRVLNSQNTIIITNNSTVDEWVKKINEYFKDNNVFVKQELNIDNKYKYNVVDIKDFEFPEYGNNYLIINYETFQLNNSSSIVNNLIKNNILDYLVIDEVQNMKKRDETKESKRRKNILTLRQKFQEKNEDMYVLVMSATPITNNLQEPKSLLEFLTGQEYDDLQIKSTLGNCINLHNKLTINGLRYKPKYDINVVETPYEIDLSDNEELVTQLLEINKKPNNSLLPHESILLPYKIEAIKDKLRKGVIVYTHYVDDNSLPIKIKKMIDDFGMDLSVGFYTGDDKTGLKNFLNRKTDILIASSPISTGVDGLQKVCDLIIPIILPWTSAEYEQLKGRIDRQGSLFESVEIFIPQVVIGEWSWDRDYKWKIVQNKKTLSQIVVDGEVPDKFFKFTEEKLYKQAMGELQKFKDRIERDDLYFSERKKIVVDELSKDNELSPRERNLNAISKIHKEWNVSKSETIKKKFKNNPHEWHEYHRLYREIRETWTEIPYKVIADKIKSRPEWIIGDFGCGENLLRKELNNKVHSFDYVAIDDTVTECDLSNIPLTDNCLDVAVFSLSLMSINYEDYLKEAFRVLKPYGMIFIAEPKSKWDNRTGYMIEIMENIGFKYSSKENSDHFYYFTFIKS